MHGMESCVSMDRTGKWHDHPCNMKMIYACKTNDGTVTFTVLSGEIYTEFLEWELSNSFGLCGKKCLLSENTLSQKK